MTLSSEESTLESVRLHYRPSKMILLFVGESPPPRKGFFYDATATEGPLSRNTRKLFEEVFETKYLDRRDFLNRFQTKGCYLFDLFKERGKTVSNATPNELETAVAELRSLIKQAKPRNVVSVLKNTRGPVKKAVRGAGIAVRYKALPFPIGEGIKEYRSELFLILSELKDAE